MKRILNLSFSEDGHEVLFQKLGKAYTNILSDIEYNMLITIDKKLVGKKIEQIDRVQYFSVDSVYGVFKRPLPPPDIQTLELLRPYYFEIYQIAERQASFYRLDVREYIYHQISYFDRVLKNNRVNLCVIWNFPHQGGDYILYALCKVKKIKVFVLGKIYNPLTREDVYYIDESIERPLEGEDLVNRELTNLQFIYDSYSVESEKTKAVLVKGEYKYNYFIDNYICLIKLFFKNIKKKNWRLNIAKVKKRICQGVSAGIGRVYYNKKACRTVGEEKYLLFALHYQPEASTLPMGGIFVDQILAIEMISKLLPEGIYLYVKEHPLSGYYRKKKYYEKILHNPNIRLFSKSYTEKDLLQNALGIITITGTIGMEAIFMHKPVIAFGYPYYWEAPGVYHPRTLNELKQVLKEISRKSICIGTEEIVKYLKTKDSLIMKNTIIQEGETVRFHPRIRELLRMCVEI